MKKSALTIKTGLMNHGVAEGVDIYGTDGETLGFFDRSYLKNMLEQSERLGVSIDEMFQQGLAAIEAAGMAGMKRAA